MGSKFLKRSTGLTELLFNTFKFLMCLPWSILPSGLILLPRPPFGDIILSSGCEGYGDVIEPPPPTLPAGGPLETPRPDADPFEGERGYKCFEYGFVRSIEVASSPLVNPALLLLFAPRYLFLRSCTPSILSFIAM